MTLRPMTFRGKTTATAMAFAPHTIVRMTPTLHAVGSLPPVSPVGGVVPIERAPAPSTQRCW